MGFVVDAGSILFGGLIGGLFSKKINFRNYTALSISIMFGSS